MNVETLTVPVGHPLPYAYINRKDAALEQHFGGHPANPEDWRRRAELLRSNERPKADPQKVAAVLLAFNRRYGCSRLTEDHIAAVGSGAFTVAGGHQACLWTGPAMVIHKAVSIINAAKYAERELGQRVIPVFWIAGEDHDWDEANHAYVIGSGYELSKLSAGRPEHPRTSVTRTEVVPAVWREQIQQLADTLPDTLFKPELLGMLEKAAEQASTLTDLFASLLTVLFAGEGLVLLDADDPALRKLEAPMFERMLSEGGRLEQAYTSAGEQLTAMGYPLQAEAQPNCAHLFLYRDERLVPAERQLAGERILLYRGEMGYTDRKESFAIAPDKLLDAAGRWPELFSNNVLTRPLMQDYLLPVLATVLGPGEIAYWAQTTEAFRVFGMSMPLVVPRTSFTVTDSSIEKWMDHFGISMEEARAGLDERKKAWLNSQDDWQLDEVFARTEREFETIYAPLLDKLPQVEKGLVSIGADNKERILAQIRYLHGKAKEAHERRHDTELSRWDRISIWIQPEGKPQERVLNLTVFWNRYGSRWLEELLGVPFDPAGGHYHIRL
ncbi:bacillithiol biosynthesis cysteine-adding enzyme BshC [Paenibacillus sambharensis]|uniref:Putative cysteine ligase BshC n=1 Tax=Paenibacillus sambharensis TaxID=1803190 RepID=A0A2W1LPZ8_9BACL|nr:bacillithiol biosynthesis cysteine-adding enzyme BshC [Paenibacillus sambharensis]PZD93901.1 bacillithiol biosynthesis cysteine-adding enzyme BshC [Paenibacillus sambharensis]